MTPAHCESRPNVAAADLAALISASRELRRALSCALHLEIILAEALQDGERVDTLLRAVSALAHLNRTVAASLEEALR